MRRWNLGPGDPLALSLSTDFRLGKTDYWDDPTWELEMGGVGEPPALALYTTFGLRARAMRLFPRFLLGSSAICAPADFTTPPRLSAFFPNLLEVHFSPFPSLAVEAEYWKPAPQVVAGRWKLVNRSDAPMAMTLEQCALLAPLDGQAMEPMRLQLTQILVGSMGGMAVVLFLTGGPRAGSGPYPSLALDLLLEPHVPRTFTWVLVTLAGVDAAFELARRTAACRWEAERARIELLNASQTIEIHTGNADWDAALALSQKEAFRLLLGSTASLPHPSFVLARRPEHGYARRTDGSDHPSLWQGQSPLEAYYLAGLLPGAPAVAVGLLENFLATQQEDGFVDGLPGLAGQRGRYLATPLLASLAWKAYQQGQDSQLPESLFRKLTAFYRLWFSPTHDRDGDGFPEWEHPWQIGSETMFDPELGCRKVLAATEDPVLGAMLCREGKILAHMAGLLGRVAEQRELESLAEAVRAGVEACWQASSASYWRRDFRSHRSPRGVRLHRQRGNGVWEAKKTFDLPVRLLICLEMDGMKARQPEVIVRGRQGRRARREYLRRADFEWGAGRPVAVTEGLFTALEEVQVRGLGERDRWSVSVVNYAGDEYILLLPLWAEIPSPERADAMIAPWLNAGRTTGILQPSGARHARKPRRDPWEVMRVYGRYLPWIHLIGEGLLAYGRREEAARLLEQVMTAVVQNLKQWCSFFQIYQAESGAGLGERGHLAGLVPVGLFLDVLGVRFLSPLRVMLSGKNPFPWPVVVQYRGTQVIRRLDETMILFANGCRMSVQDPSDGIVSAED